MSGRGIRAVLYVVALAGVVALVGVAAERHGRAVGIGSNIIFPDQVIPLRFDHKVHIVDADMECSECHESVETSQRVEDRNLPEESDCLVCHEAEGDGKPPAKGEPPAGCEVCHPGIPKDAQPGHKRPMPPLIQMPDARIEFNHALHLKHGAKCSDCHGDVSKVGLATREQLPRMADCLVCHDGKQASSRCQSCHESTTDQRIRIDYPEGQLVPYTNVWGMAHGPGYVKSHEVEGRSSEKLCLECHRKSECVDCHAGIRKPMKVHPGNFVTSHAVFARGQALQCNSCHRQQSFCLGCHQRMGVAREFKGFNVNNPDGSLIDTTTLQRQQNPASNDPNGNPIKFHPDGWVIGLRNENHHAVHAQRNISSCVSCHREETCLSCHSSRELGGTFAVQPHPNFRGKCDTLRARNERRCLKCHTRTGLDMACR